METCLCREINMKPVFYVLVIDRTILTSSLLSCLTNRKFCVDAAIPGFRTIITTVKVRVAKPRMPWPITYAKGITSIETLVKGIPIICDPTLEDPRNSLVLYY